jgi:hypothetical protein
LLTVTVQVARLDDNDIVGEGDFRDGAAHVADLSAAATFGGSLHAPAGPGRAEIPTLETALALHGAMQAFAPAALEGEEVYTARGAALPQKTVNGQAVDEVPDWNDLLPAYHQDKDDTEGLADW